MWVTESIAATLLASTDQAPSLNPPAALADTHGLCDRPRGTLAGVDRDDDDWVGTPPEGRHSRDRARPEFWARQPLVGVAAAILGVLLVGLLFAVLLD
jgi:hypothetical protein